MQRVSTNREQIKNWIKKKIREGDKEDIVNLILLLSKSVEESKWPVFSSFPGNIEGEVSYKDSVTYSEEKEKNRISYPKSLIMKLVKFLSPIQTAIFCFRFIDERTQEDVAKTLGCTHQYISQQEKNVKSILDNSREFREFYKENYGKD